MKTKIKIEFKARQGAWFSNAKAKIYGKRIKELSSQNKDKITSKIVIEDAKKKSSPLHDAFEWNNSKAADKYRLHQAALLVGHIFEVYVYNNKKVERPMCYNFYKGEKVRYSMTAETIMKRTDLKQRMLAQALWEISSWQNRYNQYEDLIKIFNAIKNVKKKLKI